MQIQVSRLLQKPADLDLHCLQRQGISGLSRTRVKLTKPALCNSKNSGLLDMMGWGLMKRLNETGSVIFDSFVFRTRDPSS